MENKKRIMCFYNGYKVEPLFKKIEEYKRKHFIEKNKMPTLDDIALDIFIPALDEKLK